MKKLILLAFLMLPIQMFAEPGVPEEQSFTQKARSIAGQAIAPAALAASIICANEYLYQYQNLYYPLCQFVLLTSIGLNIKSLYSAGKSRDRRLPLAAVGLAGALATEVVARYDYYNHLSLPKSLHLMILAGGAMNMSLLTGSIGNYLNSLEDKSASLNNELKKGFLFSTALISSINILTTCSYVKSTLQLRSTFKEILR